MSHYDDLISGRDALHRLDLLTSGAREEFDAATRASEGHSRRRAELARLKTEGYRQLAAMRLDVIKGASIASLTAAEKEAARLLADHERFVATIGGEVEKAAAATQSGWAISTWSRPRLLAASRARPAWSTSSGAFSAWLG